MVTQFRSLLHKGLFDHYPTSPPKQLFVLVRGGGVQMSSCRTEYISYLEGTLQHCPNSPLFSLKLTKDRNMAAVVYLSQTAVILTKRSSSHPRGVRLESPNLSAALLDLVAYGRPGLHSAATVMSVYMLYSCKAIMLISVFQTRPPCIYFHLNIRVPLH